MKAPPQWSLVRRLTLGVLGVVLMAFALQVVVLSLWLRPFADQFIGVAADSARLTRAALHAAPAAERETLAQTLSIGSTRLQPYTSDLEEALGPPPAVDPPEIESHTRVLAKEGIRMGAHEGTGRTDRVTFRFEVDGRNWLLVREVSHPRSAIAGTLTLWMLMIALATAVALLWSLRAIARPLDDLATQLGAQEGQLHMLPAMRFESRELHTVVQAFNGLAHKVRYESSVRQQLLAGVSHDLRTPLARLRLRVETQCPDDLAGELTSDLLALEHIVDQFLAYVQGDVAELPGSPSPLADCVREVVASYHAAGQPVTLLLDPMLVHPVPPLAVQQLLGNLIDNALHYGRAPIHVQLLQSSGCPELVVWDRGLGMTENEFARALQPFVRLGGNRTDVGHCGLGLAIATQMARHLRGRLLIRRDSSLGFGVVLRMQPPPI